MKIPRRDFIVLMGGAAITRPLAARAQQRNSVQRIGVLLNYNRDDKIIQTWMATFLDEMKARGWTEGKNIKLEYRWVGNDVALMI